MGGIVLNALAVMLILEGAFPLLLPQVWREAFKRMMMLNDGQLRFVGLVYLMAGLILLLLSR